MRNAHPTQPSIVLRGLLTAALLLLSSGAARAANPYAARYSHDATGIFWLMHISDTHIGASSVEGPNALPHLEFALGEAFTVIDPVVVINTGDLTDGSVNIIPASGQSDVEWGDYRAVIDGAGLTVDDYIDVPGNHDAYGESSAGDLEHYLTWSLNGSTFGTKTRTMVLSFSFGQYLIHATSTPNEGSPIWVEHAEFSLDEVTELVTALSTYSSATLALVFGHHYVHQPDNSNLVIDALGQNQAFWFHGHDHAFGTYLSDDNILSGQVNSLGKGDVENLGVIAVDNDALSYAAADVDDPWPLIVVTTPASRRLHDGEVSPYAYDVCNTASDNPVRALVFDATAVTEVSFTVPLGTPTAMSQDPVEPRLWHGAWDTSWMPAGETDLVVTATSASGSRSQTVKVMLADVTCPEEPPAPDAGVADAGAPDAGPPPTPDAAPTEDASTMPPDGSPVPGSPSGGCDCRTDGGPAPSGLAVLALLMLWLVRRRRTR